MKLLISIDLPAEGQRPAVLEAIGTFYDAVAAGSGALDVLNGPVTDDGGRVLAMVSVQDETEGYVDTSEAATITGLCRQRIWQLAKAGRVESLQSGRGLLIKRASALAYKASVRTPGRRKKANA